MVSGAAQCLLQIHMACKVQRWILEDSEKDESFLRNLVGDDIDDSRMRWEAAWYVKA